MTGRPLTLLVVLALGASGCAATEVDVAALRVPLSYRGAGRLTLTVEDARADTEPADLGVRRITMGIPRAVQVTGGRPLAEALQVALADSLTAAGFEVGPDGRPLTVRVRALEGDGYFGELALTYELELALAAEGKLAAAEVRRAGKRVGTYRSSDDYAVAYGEALTAVLADLLAARRLVGRGAPAQPPAAAVCPDCKQPLQPDWVVCPRCGRKR